MGDFADLERNKRVVSFIVVTTFKGLYLSLHLPYGGLGNRACAGHYRSIIWLRDSLKAWCLRRWQRAS